MNGSLAPSYSPSSGSSTSARTDKLRVKLGRAGTVDGRPKPMLASTDGYAGGTAPKLKDPEPLPAKVKPKPSISSCSSDLTLKPVDQRSGGGLSSLFDHDTPGGVDDDEEGRPKLKDPNPENGLAEEATDEPSSSSRSGSAISWPGLSGRSGEGVGEPVSFSSAFRRYSSFSFSASAPRPLGSNLRRVPRIEFGRDKFAGDEGEDGKEGEFGIPSEVGLEVSFRFGSEIEFDRV